MVELFAILLVIGVFIVGFAAGFTFNWAFRRVRYDGILKLEETERGLLYSLELAQDPELLANHKEVRFKVDAPSYEKLLSQ
jgi:hypothetical protein